MKDTILGYSSNDFYYTNASDISNGGLISNPSISCDTTSSIEDSTCANLISTAQNALNEMKKCYVREVCKNKTKSAQLKTFLPENISVSNEKYENAKSDYNIIYLKRMNYIIGIITSITISIYYITKK
jgi:hypothetical protein